MASNPTPENPDIARALADRMADGCHLHEVAINIKQNTEVVMRAASLVMKNAQIAVGTAKANVGAISDALKLVDESSTTVLTNCRLRLVNLLGQFWSPAWEATLFPDQSTAVPENQGQRLSLLENLAVYFTNNPASESVDLGATAALCTAAATALSDARQVHGTAKTNQTTKLHERDAALKELRKRIRSLIEELTLLLADDDARWEDFGLTIPANPSAPEGIASITVSAPGNGKIHAEWPYSTRTVDGLEKTLSGFVPGVIVKVKTIPFNDGGDGPESPEGTVTVI